MGKAIRMCKIFTHFVLPAWVVAVMAIESMASAANPQEALASAGAVKKVAVIADPALGEPARYGIGKLEAALRAKDIAVSEGEGQLSGSDLVLLLGLGDGRGAAAAALAEIKVPVPNAAEALTHSH